MARDHGVPLRFLALLAVLGSLLFQSSAAAEPPIPGPTIEQTGPEQTVHDSSAQRCEPINYADLGARAFRDSAGGTQLILSHYRNYRMAGSSLNSLNRDCTLIMDSHRQNSPSSFNNREWIAAPYTLDGQTIHSLVYDEFYGWEAGQCQGRTTFTTSCWYSGITLAKSTDRGNSYTHTTPPAHLVASAPYQYEEPPLAEIDTRSQVGYFNPSNIMKGRDGVYYSMVTATAYKDQKWGTCVMRTGDITNPASWRAYGDGEDSDTTKSFEVRFVNPYTYTFTATDTPKHHLCEPVDVPDINGMNGGISWNRYFGKYLLVGVGHDTTTGADLDVYYSLSDDLVNWSPREMLLDAETVHDPCASGDDMPLLYATVLDHNSTTRNFDTTGQDVNLYFTRMLSGTCTGAQRWDFGQNRDLIRIPIRFKAKPEGDRLATLEDGQIVHSSTGYDSGWGGTPGSIEIDPANGYEGPGNKSAKLWSLGGSTGPFGTFNVSWPNGKDVWYGSAFQLQPSFAAVNDRIMLIRWGDSVATPPTPNVYAGVVLGADDRYRLVRGRTGGSEDTLGSSFTLPEGPWFWLEVHQKLESSSGNSPETEVFVNGQLVSSSRDPNAYPDADGVPKRVQFGYAQRTQGNATVMWVDRSSISVSQRGALGAPATPGAIGGSEQDAFMTMWWNSVPNATYRVYKRLPGGNWTLRFNNLSTSATLETGLPNCTRIQYRVSAVNAVGVESVVSEPLEIMPRPAGGCP